MINETDRTKIDELLTAEYVSGVELNRLGFVDAETHLAVAFYRQSVPQFKSADIRKLVDAGLILQTR